MYSDRKQKNTKMNITKYRPASKLAGFPVTFNDLFDNFFSEGVDNKMGGESFFRPGVDVIENENLFEVHVAIPGIRKEDINLDISNNELKVSGERKEKKAEDGEKYHMRELRYGKFSRTFRLPENADKSKIEAKFEDGILKVVIPKSVESLSKHIEIK